MQEFATLLSMIAGYLAGTNGLGLLAARRASQPDRAFLLHRHASRLFMWIGALAFSAFILLEVPLFPGGPDTAAILNPRLPDQFEIYVLFVAAGFMALCAYLIVTGFMAAGLLLLTRVLSRFPTGRPHSEITRTVLAAGRFVLVFVIAFLFVPAYATALLLSLFSESWPLYGAIASVSLTAPLIPVIDILLLTIYPRLATPFMRKLAEPLGIPGLRPRPLPRQATNPPGYQSQSSERRNG